MENLITTTTATTRKTTTFIALGDPFPGLIVIIKMLCDSCGMKNCQVHLVLPKCRTFHSFYYDAQRRKWINIKEASSEHEIKAIYL